MSNLQITVTLPDSAENDELSLFSVASGVDGDELQDALNPWFHWNKLKALPEFEHLEQASLAFLFRHEEKVKAGRRILGTCYMPRVQGELAPMFEWLLDLRLGYMPDFMIVLERQWWIEASEREREILVYHEASHADQAKDQYGAPRFDKFGNPVWAIVGHDVEEFQAVVAKYGAWKDDIRAFILAAEQADKPPRKSNEPLF